MLDMREFSKEEKCKFQELFFGARLMQDVKDFKLLEMMANKDEFEKRVESKGAVNYQQHYVSTIIKEMQRIFLKLGFEKAEVFIHNISKHEIKIDLKETYSWPIDVHDAAKGLLSIIKERENRI